MLIVFNKPFNVLSQFTDRSDRPTLADFIDLRHLRPAGRLDFDSEGLLLLTDDGILQARIANPHFKQPKTYWVQVEGVPDAAALAMLERGVRLPDGLTRPAQVHPIADPPLWPRAQPIRTRRRIPTSWIQITIREGRNRQVRRMTAAVGFPTLRLVRVAIGPYSLDELAPGHWREGDPTLIQSPHDLEAQRGSRGNSRKGRKIPAGRGRIRRANRPKSTRRTS